MTKMNIVNPKVNTFDHEDNFCWNDFDAKYRDGIFNSYEELLEEFKRDIVKVLRWLSCGDGYYVKKTNLTDLMFDITKKLDTFPIRYRENSMKVIKGKIVQTEVELEIKSKKLIDIVKTEITSTEMVFRPSGKCNETQFNCWRGFIAKEVEINNEKAKLLIDEFCHYVYFILANKDKAVSEYILNWLAKIIQTPEERPETACVFFGEEGTGKNRLFEFYMKFVLGYHLCVSLEGGLMEATSQFNSFLGGKLLVVTNELQTTKDDFSSSLNKFKARITEPTLLIEKKGLDKVKIDNFVNYILLSNNTYVIKVGANDRHYMIQEVSNEMKGRVKDDFFKRFTDLFFNQESGNIIFTYLKQRDLKQWGGQRNLPMTEAKKLLVELSEPNAVVFLKNVIDKEKKVFKFRIGEINDDEEDEENVVYDEKKSIAASELYQKYENWCSVNGEKSFSSKIFGVQAKSILESKRSNGIKYMVK